MEVRVSVGWSSRTLPLKENGGERMRLKRHALNNSSWAWSLPWREVDTPGDTPSKKTDLSFAIRYQLHMSPQLRVGFHYSFPLPVLRYYISWTYICLVLLRPPWAPMFISPIVCRRLNFLSELTITSGSYTLSDSSSSLFHTRWDDRFDEGMQNIL